MSRASRKQYSSSSIVNGQSHKSSQNQTSTIVLFVSSHGEQLRNVLTHPGVEIKMLSFVSQYGQEGTMKPRPFKQTRKSLDEIALSVSVKYLKRRYTIKKRSISNVLLQYAKALQPIYQKAFVGDVRQQVKFSNGFKLVVPKKDRHFVFSPNHESGEPDFFYPHYGLHIMDVDGLSIDHPMNRFQAIRHPVPTVTNRSTFDYGNLTYHTGSNATTNTIVTKNSKIIYESIRTTVEHSSQRECFRIYDQLMNDAVATLTDIIFLFTKLGFTQILFIDPSCRSMVDVPASAAIARHNADSLVSQNSSPDSRGYQSSLSSIFSQSSSLSSPPPAAAVKPSWLNFLGFKPNNGV